MWPKDSMNLRATNNKRKTKQEAPECAGIQGRLYGSFLKNLKEGTMRWRNRLIALAWAAFAVCSAAWLWERALEGTAARLPSLAAMLGLTWLLRRRGTQ